MSFLKTLLSKMPALVQDIYLLQKKKVKLSQWEKNGKQLPVPHAVKQNAIEEYQLKYNIKNLIETGTYLGDMIWAQRKNFQKIYSIELNMQLADKAQKRFKKYKYIHILQGDSGIVLYQLVPEMKDRTIFWLDGHYSSGITARGNKDCPIYEELQAIFDSGPDHILLIDDARCFIGQSDYPTIEELSATIRAQRPNSQIEVKDDIIRVVLSKT
ncbi:hypothetical protein JGH11_08060 [Dysgonomonas sp. Marseille-P4677]|uniref:hypothetical protein n=1 Tax=Dysgonomonas sp. Marseille-P4677 TaxID=2364790 RepID=UPI0019139CCF|nr:hypothetical protein [Dysgonomonas sp. Marseille-P4677]MBK5720825.1 hypothetical protein [Dysgonomonas sp. Marseille-P4677]